MNNQSAVKQAGKKIYRLVFVMLAALSGCSSNDNCSDGCAGVNPGYYSITHYDPWYYGGYYGDVDVYVPDYPVYDRDPANRPERPIRGEGITRPSHPIARPGLRPESRPSLPSRARPMGYSRPSGFSRGMGGMRGGGRRR